MGNMASRWSSSQDDMDLDGCNWFLHKICGKATNFGFEENCNSAVSFIFF